MKVTRDVILDLLPLYLAGEASSATRELVEEYLAQDPELARQVRSSRDSPGLPATPAPQPDVELQSLARTRALIALQMWVFGLAIAFTAIGLALRITFHEGHLSSVRFVVLDYPRELGTCLLIGAACWIGYFVLKRRLKV
jgi:hypothetical protein